MTPFQHIHLESVDSTNNFLRSFHPEQEAAITLVTANYQTSGRGQRGNSWESELGRNLIFSILVHPSALKPSHMFSLSEVIALSVCKMLNEQLTAEQLQRTGGFTVKWPNDIYYQDNKVAGILIETDLMGSRISNAIMGVGININQQSFVSDAPNPISLLQITHQEYDLSALLNRLMQHFCALYQQMEDGQLSQLHTEYMQHLYRREGFYPFADENGPFQARIHDVELTGHLILQDTEHRSRRYAFKEVQFIIAN